MKHVKKQKGGNVVGLKGYVVKRPLNILTEEEAKRIHYGALEVMERTGVVFHHKKGRWRF